MQNKKHKKQGITSSLYEKVFSPREAQLSGDPIQNSLPGNEKNVYYKQFFYVAMGSLAAVFFIVLFLTNGYSMRGLLLQARDQTFMDFFNSLLYNMEEPYENAVFYPPLSTLMYKLLLLMVPQSLIDKVVANKHTTAFTPEIKLYQQFYIPFIFYTIVTLVALYYAINAAKKGGRGEKLLFLFLMMLSAPMLFMFERANNIIIVLALCLVFIALYNDERAVRREFALIALSAAIATKLYPIVFCALLLRKKRIKELIRVAIYSGLLFVVPFFLFYDGFKSLSLLLTNLTSYSGNIELTMSQLNFAKMPIFPLFLTNLSNEMLLGIGEAFKIVVTFSAIIAAFFVDKEWKSAALCCCILYGFQGTCAAYLLVMFFIPIIMMLDNERTHSVKNYICLALMILTVGLIVSLNPVTGQFTRAVGTKISSYAVMLLTFLLIYDGMCGLIRKLSALTAIRKGILAAIAAACFALVLVNVICIAPGSIFGLIDLSGIIHSALIKNAAVCAAAVFLFCLSVFLICFFGKSDDRDGLGLARQFLKFSVVGVSNTLISLLIYYIFYWISPSLYFAGNVAGFIVSVCNAYYWNNKYVFRAEKGSRIKTLLKTFASYSATFCLSSLLLVLMIEVLRVPGLIAPLINLVVTVPLNFVLNKLWAFQDNRNTFREAFAHAKQKVHTVWETLRSKHKK